MEEIIGELISRRAPVTFLLQIFLFKQDFDLPTFETFPLYDYLEYHFDDVVSSREWLDFTLQNVRLFVNKRNLRVSDEEIVLLGIRNWVEHNLRNDFRTYWSFPQISKVSGYRQKIWIFESSTKNRNSRVINKISNLHQKSEFPKRNFRVIVKNRGFRTINYKSEFSRNRLKDLNQNMIMIIVSEQKLFKNCHIIFANLLLTIFDQIGIQKFEHLKILIIHSFTVLMSDTQPVQICGNGFDMNLKRMMVFRINLIRWNEINLVSDKILIRPNRRFSLALDLNRIHGAKIRITENTSSENSITFHSPPEMNRKLFVNSTKVTILVFTDT